MTVFHLPSPEPATAPLTTAERLDRMDSRIDAVIDGIREILREVVALRERIDLDR